ncbi:30S ribosomal protein S11 [candidate division Kazan bacterium RIFCSPHIGHO2_01_FULL_44_14]|uniref:Small ribosomal subunit protein uS11 n=1 Tax=candidate division Kazan bacterium RIFCSPLOWO2_01_FULL_45_19 TaxID=1798538 RepID=A0A1F4NR73_UNCK3|nr:MAG: 30S ribosomal protein S11 [candidate division Kazan bacterium RIFCSPLOWO2_01_FULL_45_19]OGB78111.1 MAG: 30S ribosomal protein S11 [candidate division Kazan bacterium RIFCSPHIGHO2_01_FULL_44_14]
MAAKAAAKPKKKRVKLNVVEGRVYIKSTFNNTLITITDTEGRVIATGSAGQQGFRGSKKSTSFAASKAASAAIGKALTTGLQRLQIFVQGVGTGRDAAIRAIAQAGVDVTSIKDMTPIPHNGPRARKARRV